EARTGVHARGVAARALGRLRLPGAADDRRPRAAPAREARARPRPARADPDGAERRLPLRGPALRRFRSVGAQLGVALTVVVAGALVVVWVVLVPTLQ